MPDSPPRFFKGLTSPILLQGDANTAYRDPAALYHDGVWHLFFTWVTTTADGETFMVLGTSRSRDLARWTPPEALTPRNRARNFSSPGNVVRVGDEWVLCLQTYPRPHGAKYGNGESRLWTMRSRDLIRWDEPELLRVKGPNVPVAEMGRMIDPYLLEDKDEPGRWWCFFKQNGVSRAWSHDLRHWTFAGRVDAGENVCVLVVDGEYVLLHSPDNGIGVKRSVDLRSWRDEGLLTLGQADWPWAQGRLTAGFVLDLRTEPGIGKFVLFFHGSGPEDERTMFDDHASLGLAWSDDLRRWDWPGRHVPGEGLRKRGVYGGLRPRRHAVVANGLDVGSVPGQQGGDLPSGAGRVRPAAACDFCRHGCSGRLGVDLADHISRQRGRWFLRRQCASPWRRL